MKKLLVLSLFISFMFVGCVTTANYKNQLSAFVGQSSEVLIAKWGAPTARFARENGDEVIAYIRYREIVVPGTPIYTLSTDGRGLVATPASATSTPTGTLNLSCMTKFVVRDKVIQSSAYEGDGCKSLK